MSIPDIIASMIATSLAELATAPICLVRSNIIKNTNHIKIKDEVKRIYYNEGGLLAFYRASVPSVLGQIISSSSKYTIYRYLNKNFNEETNNLYRILYGSITGIVVSAITHPIDYIKVHLQVKEQFYEKLKQNYINMYSGYRMSFYKASLGGAFFFPIYEFVKDKTNSPTLSALISATFSTVLLQPIDFMKNRGILSKSFHKGELFKGLGLNLLRIIPHFIITMVFTEKILKLIN
jgi:hypothetical protein